MPPLKHRYLAAEGDKQATFTGAEQRAGVFVLAYAVAGIFGRGRPRAAKNAANHGDNGGDDEGTGPPPSGGRRGKSKGGPARGKKSGRGKKAGTRDIKLSKGAGLFGGGDDDDDEELPDGFKFDWDAYRVAFGDTPIQDAVTIMFAEYASLYARIAGWTTSAAPAPMTMEEGESIHTQANNFILNIMTPILGFVHTSKVHKLLRHLLESIRYHGHLRHGNTGANEAAHKSDKNFYRRTNMALETFTGQLVRQAQGAREVGRRNDVADAHALRTCPLVTHPAGRRAGAADGHGCAETSNGDDGQIVGAGERSQGGDGDGVGGTRRVRSVRRGEGDEDVRDEDVRPVGASAATSGAGSADGGGIERVGGGAGAVAAATPAVPKPRRRSPDYLKRKTLGTLAQRPGLTALPALFGLPPNHRVPVLSTVEFTATFDCGTTTKQLLRASPQFRDDRSWYDAILFTVDKGVATTNGSDGYNTGRGAAVGDDAAGGVASSVVSDGTGGSRGDDASGITTEAEATLHAGEVRAIIRCKEDDFAIVCEMDPVLAETGCPFDARYCTRLKWRVTERGGWVIRGVPLSQVRRLIHVVPDFKDLASRKGLQAAPAAYGAPQPDRIAMRYFCNDFFPWK